MAAVSRCATVHLADPSWYPDLWEGAAACVQALRADGRHLAGDRLVPGSELVPVNFPDSFKP